MQRGFDGGTQIGPHPTRVFPGAISIAPPGAVSAVADVAERMGVNAPGGNGAAPYG